MAHNLPMYAGHSILIVLGYLVRLSTVPDNKDKYDFINKNELISCGMAALCWFSERVFFFNEISWAHNNPHFLRAIPDNNARYHCSIDRAEPIEIYYPFHCLPVLEKFLAYSQNSTVLNEEWIIEFQ